MLNMLKGAALTAAALGGLALGSQAASAMPMIDVQPSTQVATAVTGAVQDVRWVCGPYGCAWRHPHWRPYPVYGYGPGWGGPGWGGPGPWGWHHHHHWHHPWYPGPYGY